MGMEFTEIDRQFDEAFERIQRRSPVVANAYGTAPLAADHFLLKKSWDYFRGRVKAIEDQWRKMMEAKDQQLRSTLSELQVARQRKVDLEEENNMLRSLDQNIKKARTEDFLGFSRKSENLRVHWDAEREALLLKIAALETKIPQIKKTYDLRISTAQVREDKWKEMIEVLKQEASLHEEREREVQKRCSAELVLKDEKIQSLDTKLDLTRGEVDRRERLIKELQESIAIREKDANAMTAYVAELQRTLKEKDLELGHRQVRLEIFSQEKENIRSTWERERAEWRELWDRGRSLWDKKAS